MLAGDMFFIEEDGASLYNIEEVMSLCMLKIVSLFF